MGLLTEVIPGTIVSQFLAYAIILNIEFMKTCFGELHIDLGRSYFNFLVRIVSLMEKLIDILIVMLFVRLIFFLPNQLKLNKA